jgi:hypothetical protein
VVYHTLNRTSMAASPVPSPEQPQRVRGIQCSDCRNVSRTTYWALNERPVCAKCKQQYAERIQRATGPGAMTRVLVQGIFAALGGAIITAIGISIFGMTRILFSVGVGFLIGSVIKRANGGWPGRKYQVLAVSLTYFALGLGAITPTLLSYRAASREIRRAAADSVAAARARAAAADSASDDDADKATESPTDGLAAMADSMEAERSKAPVHTSPEMEKAKELARLPTFAVIGGAVLLMITAPILANLQYGIYAAGLGLLAFGFGMKKAWDLTEGGIELQLSGPFKVGEGPIAPSF